jgi:hypothetical protein
MGSRFSLRKRPDIHRAVEGVYFKGRRGNCEIGNFEALMPGMCSQTGGEW